MAKRFGILAGTVCLVFSLGAGGAVAQEGATGRLFAVEIRTGPAWDAARPAHEQAWFREHSAHLRKLREQGGLVLGARYADKGFIVLRAASADEARAMMDEDASIRHATFRYELHDFNVFYGGAVQPAPRPANPR